jgi:hypothetical protein
MIQRMRTVLTCWCGFGLWLPLSDMQPKKTCCTRHWLLISAVSSVLHQPLVLCHCVALVGHLCSWVLISSMVLCGAAYTVAATSTGNKLCAPAELLWHLGQCCEVCALIFCARSFSEGTSSTYWEQSLPGDAAGALCQFACMPWF